MRVMGAALSLGRRMRLDDIAARAALLALATNAALMVAKIVIGIRFGSIALLGDGIDSGQDVVASGLVFFTVRLALQPADERHPYGHGKAEGLAALAQAALLGGGALFITIASVRRIAGDDVEIVVGPSLAMAIVTALVNLAVAAYALRAARMTGSVAVHADARHLLTNVAQAIAIVTGLLLVGATGDHVYDPIVALMLAAYLAWTAAHIAGDSVPELIDSSLPEDVLRSLDACIQHESHQIRGYHALRTRRSGRQTYVDLHVVVDPAISVAEAHALVEDLEGDIRGMLPGAVVTVHVDPDEPLLRDGASAEPEAHQAVRLHRH